jgi:hypothetical protein
MTTTYQYQAIDPPASTYSYATAINSKGQIVGFAKAESALTEGLAQYYMDRVLHRLQRSYAGAFNIFLTLLTGQPDVCRSHEPWVRHSSPEAVRRAMLEIRRWSEG